MPRVPVPVPSMTAVRADHQAVQDLVAAMGIDVPVELVEIRIVAEVGEPTTVVLTSVHHADDAPEPGRIETRYNVRAVNVTSAMEGP